MTKKISRYDVLLEQLQSINNQLDRLDFDITLSGATVNRHLKKIMKSRQSYLLKQIKLEKHNL